MYAAQTDRTTTSRYTTQFTSFSTLQPELCEESTASKTTGSGELVRLSQEPEGLNLISVVDKKSQDMMVSELLCYIQNKMNNAAVDLCQASTVICK